MDRGTAGQLAGAGVMTASAPPSTIEEAGAALREGSATSVELTTRALERADRHDGWLGSFITRFDKTALARAARADEELSRGTDLGPLHGIPVGVKDILAAREGPTTAQSAVLDPSWGAGTDAVVVSRLRAAGAVIVGKTTTMEFAIGLPEASKSFPVPVNPWRPDRWCGGSSSGSASGVVAGFFLAGIGSDTGGSIRIPSAYCGVTGLLPTFGRVPRTGVVPLGFSLDRVGPLARTTWDCAAVLQSIVGPDAGDPDSVDAPLADLLAAAADEIAGLRIGAVREHHLDGADAAVTDAYEAAIATLQELGAEVGEASLPLYHELTAATLLSLWCEAGAYHQRNLAQRWSDYTVTARMMIGSSAFISGADYVQAQRVRRVGQRKLGELLQRFDLLVAPTISMPAPLLEAAMDPAHGTRLHTLYWNSLGNPVLALPIGFADGLPLSMQLAAAPFSEATLVRAGCAFQRHTDWHRRVPELEPAHG
jgi:aspartyl-tRNA(Asn)/glutamyl-tRNA(Gln) amidotransferase subunit A